MKTKVYSVQELRDDTWITFRICPTREYAVYLCNLMLAAEYPFTHFRVQS